MAQVSLLAIFSIFHLLIIFKKLLQLTSYQQKIFIRNNNFTMQNIKIFLSLLFQVYYVYAGLIVQQSGTIIIPIPVPSTYSIKLNTSPSDIVQKSKDWPLNTQIISSITKIQLKGKTSFQFTFTLNAQNATVDYKFQGSNISQIEKLSIDYLLFRNGTSAILNMTDFQWHLQWPKPDALVMFLNGFSEFQLSGNISYLYIGPSQIYTIHYMGNHTHQGYWGKNFLLYSIILIPYNPIQSCQNCKPIQKFRLTDDSLISASQTNVQYFFGLKGYSGNKFKGQFVYVSDIHSSDVQFQFDKQYSEFETTKHYSIVAIPYEIIDNYADLRLHKIKPNQHTYVLVIILVVITIISLWFLLFALIRKFLCKNSSNMLFINKSQLYQLNEEATIATKNIQPLEPIQQVEAQRQQSKNSQNSQPSLPTLQKKNSTDQPMDLRFSQKSDKSNK